MREVLKGITLDNGILSNTTNVTYAARGQFSCCLPRVVPNVGNISSIRCLKTKKQDSEEVRGELKQAICILALVS